MFQKFDDDVGRPLFEACENSVEDETRIIAKAAKVIRKYIVESDEIFDGVCRTTT